MSDYTSLFSIFDAYSSKLTSREVNQLKNANASSCYFVTNIIRPMLFNSHSYVSLSEDKQRVRDSVLAADIARAPTDDDLQYIQFFTNPLLNVAKDHESFHRPSKRVALCDNVVLTFEYDSTDINFFKHTLSWFRSAKKPINAPIGRFLSSVRAAYADCRGLNVTYSGSKSFHLHFVFSTELLKLHGTDYTSIRDGFTATWLRLSSMLAASPDLNIPVDIRPDASIRFPDSFRRIPLGVRPVDGEHYFNLPAGSRVPQAVMWEMFYDRAAKGCANVSVFDPADFLRPIQVARKSTARVKSPAHILGDSALHAHLTREIIKYFPDGSYPQFSHYGENAGEIAAYFSNSPTDYTPDSLIKQDWWSVHLVGTGSDLIETKSLPRTLGEMIEEWTADFDSRLNAVDRERTPEEQKFAEVSTSQASAIDAIGGILRTKIGSAGAHWIAAPEGISKSRSLFDATHQAINDLVDYDLPANTMYAFATYALAKEKCAEFRQGQINNPKNFRRPIKAIVLKSFSRVYKEACAALRIDELTIHDTIAGGYNSLYDTIQDRQPDAMSEIRIYYKKKRLIVSGKTPVIFTVHDVAHDWHKNTWTRRMFSAAFWSKDRENLFNRCREDTHLGIMIHDEVAATDLITMVPASTRDWIDRLRADSSSWSSSGLLVDRWQSYNAVSSAYPAPVGFQEANKLAAVVKWDNTLTTAYSGEYGEPREDDIYAATAGNDWLIKQADWFATARTTIVLTTEAVPTIIARHIGEPWVITELDTPFLDRDSVQTRLFDRLTSTKLLEVVSAERTDFLTTTGKELLCISNKASSVATTHKTAKGSNAFIAKPVLQTMVMMAPSQYEFSEVLNALTDRQDMVMLTHLDDFNQSAGRNLGFRYRDGAEHHLVINRRLYLLLANSCLGRSRYQMKPIIGRYDRRNASKDKTSPALRALQLKLKGNNS